MNANVNAKMSHENDKSLEKSDIKITNQSEDNLCMGLDMTKPENYIVVKVK